MEHDGAEANEEFDEVDRKSSSDDDVGSMQRSENTETHF